MSERKVLQKYYPPDFDPSAIEKRRKGPKQTGPKIQPVRLMAPFSMKCTSCGEYIYKGRKFNARKETTEEKYYAISIFRFYIRCTRCSAEITFKTDPKNMDYSCERGARRNFEPWREAKLAEETEEERLDRLEREEGERDKMVELEQKTNDAQMEMRIADALDDVRMRNAMRERGGGVEGALQGVAMDRGKGNRDEEAERVEREIEEQARRAFLSATGERVRRLDGDIELDDSTPVPGPSSSSSSSSSAHSSARSSLDNSSAHLPDPSEHPDKAAMPPPPPPSTTTTTTTAFQRKTKTKKDFASSLGIKKPVAPSPATPAIGNPDDGAAQHTDPPPDRSPATASTPAANGAAPPKKGGGGGGVGIGLVDYGSESSDED
ncbi:hypothetical protein KC343_g13230 [Hortaea werneckii]|uniref:Splicing factor YJU2 n=1 Tax=Hortaea werneckii TaxID=91943 RepID=A0A3M7G6Z0_HORWE|nr:hypothetical protein KC323_g9466 [Hortaea werneckii]KAI7600930.1 hypothetical protein KC346_g13047 [Hortaea werneckii]KAI7607000.1 hypothetical protein KC343_g13230 [Hortaea werneckii]KAI7643275.1 hypothetical protein KC319_g12708 [Hortaea werneckii]KAI7693824.1 hypothetical protein KC322_g10608 [Hortaea werneckii]